MRAALLPVLGMLVCLVACGDPDGESPEPPGPTPGPSGPAEFPPEPLEVTFEPAAVRVSSPGEWEAAEQPALIWVRGRHTGTRRGWHRRVKNRHDMAEQMITPGAWCAVTAGAEEPWTRVLEEATHVPPGRGWCRLYLAGRAEDGRLAALPFFAPDPALLAGKTLDLRTGPASLGGLVLRLRMSGTPAGGLRIRWGVGDDGTVDGGDGVFPREMLAAAPALAGLRAHLTDAEGSTLAVLLEIGPGVTYADVLRLVELAGGRSSVVWWAWPRWVAPPAGDFRPVVAPPAHAGPLEEPETFAARARPGDRVSIALEADGTVAFTSDRDGLRVVTPARLGLEHALDALSRVGWRDAEVRIRPDARASWRACAAILALWPEWDRKLVFPPGAGRFDDRLLSLPRAGESVARTSHPVARGPDGRLRRAPPDARAVEPVFPADATASEAAAWILREVAERDSGVIID